MSEEPVDPALSFHPSANLRRCTVIALPIGVVLLVALIALGHPLAGVMFVVGLWLGGLNTYFVGRSVNHNRIKAEERQRKSFITGSFARLGLVTFVAIALLVLFGKEAVTVVLGLAVFQLLTLASASIPLIKELRNT